MIATEGTRKRVFIIDDELLIARTLAMILLRAGYDAECFYSGEQALEAATVCRPDLIVTDLMLPGMSGVELAETAAQACSGLPILFVSGHVESLALVEEARQRGFNFHALPKPMVATLIPTTGTNPVGARVEEGG